MKCYPWQAGKTQMGGSEKSYPSLIQSYVDKEDLKVNKQVIRFMVHQLCIGIMCVRTCVCESVHMCVCVYMSV